MTLYRIILSILALSSISVSTSGLAQTDHTPRTRQLSELRVIGQRPMRLLGVTRSTIDSARLVESPTLSLGDLLSQSSAVFVKSYGRGTLATASFRGTSPSHTDIQWNGLRLNSPMLGQVDLSLVPSLFIDELSLWHGSSATNVASGALGGAINLENTPAPESGHRLRLTQTIGSYATLDSYARYTYSQGRWATSTRLYRADSRNDFPFRNFSKVNLLDDGSVSNEYETSHNRNSAYTDHHLLQELYYRHPEHRLSLSGHLWLLDSDRGIPMLQTDQRSEYEHSTNQREQTLRSLVRGKYIRPHYTLSASLGFSSSHQVYNYTTQTAPTVWVEAIHTSSYLRTGLATLALDYVPLSRLQLRTQVETYYHHVDTWDRRLRTGYLGSRFEHSLLLGIRYRPSSRLGLGTNLRLQRFGAETSPLGITALADYLLLPEYALRLKASAGTGHRFPTLNDLYYEPGGNPDLRPERSFSYDLGLEASLPEHAPLALSGELTLFDSYIDDWILWLPSYRGYWTPSNVRRVHNYGIETRLKGSKTFGEVNLSADFHWSYTRARNQGAPISKLDESFGKQLPYIPRFQSSLTTTLQWRAWQLLYKYNYYSTRYTTSSNRANIAYSILGAYHMSELSLQWAHHLYRMPLSLRLTIHNLLNEEYVSVLHRPMPRLHYTLSVSLNPF